MSVYLAACMRHAFSPPDPNMNTLATNFVKIKYAG